MTTTSTMNNGRELHRRRRSTLVGRPQKNIYARSIVHPRRRARPANQDPPDDHLTTLLRDDTPKDCARLQSLRDTSSTPHLLHLLNTSRSILKDITLVVTRIENILKLRPPSSTRAHRQGKGSRRRRTDRRLALRRTPKTTAGQAVPNSSTVNTTWVDKVAVLRCSSGPWNRATSSSASYRR